MEKKILLIEDEAKIARLLQLELSFEGYRVEVASNGKEGLEKALAEPWQLIVLDVMLPELNGMEVLRRFRKTDARTPIILLTARSSTAEKVSGLDQGANDYVTKPFEIEELLARMRVCLREPSQEKADTPPPVLRLKDLTVDRVTRKVSRGGRNIELTPKEFDLLVYLLDNKNTVLEREQIINRVWGYDFVGDTNVVDVYVRYLRKKIDEPHRDKLIHTIRGVGYCMKEDES
ncbi:response regulator transcription factor [Cohnella zeiphila]|uniref:Response regulator transcription factor n=1 Tax=Cohnella zeiphila TaxID=2761120 RepID=A0A7X0VXR5_9BACL|nr:response regulator transcription factor [Cohnella zeiphila]MBB6733732.1 response regulator transcription factor [Cohnella zeiphila]